MNVQHYMETTFPGLVLKPSLYLQWPIGLHFGLGQGIYQLKDDGGLETARFDAVYSQTLTLFNELFAEEDEMVLVANVYQPKKQNSRTRPLHLIRKFLKEKDFAYQIKLETHPYVFDEEEEAEDYATSRYQLKGRKSEFRYPALLKAACNEDFPLTPKFRREGAMYYPDLFFINLTKNAIFFIYDDRGCEMIAKDKETLRPFHEKYDEWLYEENRADMARLFS